MKLQWLGHSAFRLIESTNTTVITDPFEANTVGYSMAFLPSDVITSSNGKRDHNYFNGVKGNPQIINTVGMHDIAGVHIQAILHTPEDKSVASPNLIVKLRMDGVTVCHLGDIKDECSIDLVEQLMPVNILLIPVGNHDHTIDASEAKEYIEKLMPDVVIPMHYRTKSCDMELDKLETFLKEFDAESIELSDADTLEFQRDDFNGSGTKIIIPKRFKG